MTAQTYRKKPVEIQALQWTGENADELYDWAVLPSRGAIRGSVMQCFVPMDDDETFDTLRSEMFDDFRNKGATAALWVDANSQWLPLQTGEWVAKDRHGFYPIKDDVFIETYRLVDRDRTSIDRELDHQS